MVENSPSGLCFFISRPPVSLSSENRINAERPLALLRLERDNWQRSDKQDSSAFVIVARLLSGLPSIAGLEQLGVKKL